ncbi:MAG: hypothetical protein U0Y82_05735 [Thermoleophilia bacterium]
MIIGFIIAGALIVGALALAAGVVGGLWFGTRGREVPPRDDA